MSRADVIADLIQPAQWRIGELWYEGTIGVADEHRATAIVEALLLRMASTPTGSAPGHKRRCILAAVGEEQHVVGLRALQAAFEDDGWECIFLGARTPVSELLRVAAQAPALALLSAAYLPNVHEVSRAVSDLRHIGRRVMVGGPAFARVPDLWRRLGADAEAPDARVATGVARRIVVR